MVRTSMTGANMGNVDGAEKSSNQEVPSDAGVILPWWNELEVCEASLMGAVREVRHRVDQYATDAAREDAPPWVAQNVVLVHASLSRAEASVTRWVEACGGAIRGRVYKSPEHAPLKPGEKPPMVSARDMWQLEEIAAWLRGHIEELYAGSEDLASGDNASERAIVVLRNHLARALMCVRHVEDIAGCLRPMTKLVDEDVARTR